MPQSGLYMAMGDNIELGGILAFACSAGLRRGEILRLHWSNFEYHNSERTVGIFQVSGKTGKRRVPLFSELIPHLEKIRIQKEPNQEYVFAHYTLNGKKLPLIFNQKYLHIFLNGCCLILGICYGMVVWH